MIGKDSIHAVAKILKERLGYAEPLPCDAPDREAVTASALDEYLALVPELGRMAYEHIKRPLDLLWSASCHLRACFRSLKSKAN